MLYAFTKMKIGLSKSTKIFFTYNEIKFTVEKATFIKLFFKQPTQKMFNNAPRRHNFTLPF